MRPAFNETHDAKWKSWVDSANDPNTDFPIQNLPFGLMQPGHIVVAVGTQVLNLWECARAELMRGLPAEVSQACSSTSVNRLAALPRQDLSSLRLWLSRMLRTNCPGWTENRSRLRDLLISMSDAEMMVPAEVGDYTDFYASIDHATRVGRLFRPDQPLLPNYKYVPIAYHGRASSIVISGTPVKRPFGQIKLAGAEVPTLEPTQALDYEMELAFLIGKGNTLGHPIPIESAESHIFGCCLLNDWSARDIQSWEYQPLGPFLAKSFATSISPWIVTFEALAPFRCSAFARPASDPQPLTYLHSDEDAQWGGLDLRLEAFISTANMRAHGDSQVQLAASNARTLYWTAAQMITHHASNGCNLRPGDLLASGTVSGPDENSKACFLEASERGAKPVRLPNGEGRTFLENGDEIVLKGRCERKGFVGIGFGECCGRIY